MIPCFIFELSTILYDWLMTSFCLQKVKKMHEVDCVSKRKLTEKSFLELTCLLNIISYESMRQFLFTFIRLILSQKVVSSSFIVFYVAKGYSNNFTPYPFTPYPWSLCLGPVHTRTERNGTMWICSRKQRNFCRCSHEND